MCCHHLRVHVDIRQRTRNRSSDISATLSAFVAAFDSRAPCPRITLQPVVAPFGIEPRCGATSWPAFRHFAFHWARCSGERRDGIQAYRVLMLAAASASSKRFRHRATRAFGYDWQPCPHANLVTWSSDGSVACYADIDNWRPGVNIFAATIIETNRRSAGSRVSASSCSNRTKRADRLQYPRTAINLATRWHINPWRFRDESTPLH